MRKLYYLNTSAYDCVISYDAEDGEIRCSPWCYKETDPDTGKESFRFYNDNIVCETAEDLLRAVEDDSSWEVIGNTEEGDNLEELLYGFDNKILAEIEADI